jgi:hypothetical protein
MLPASELIMTSGSSQKLSEEQIKKLSSELSQLALEHASAMRDATFLGLTERQRVEMTCRRKRINEICKQLGKVSLKQAPKASLFAA